MEPSGPMVRRRPVFGCKTASAVTELQPSWVGPHVCRSRYRLSTVTFVWHFVRRSLSWGHETWWSVFSSAESRTLLIARRKSFCHHQSISGVAFWDPSKIIVSSKINTIFLRRNDCEFILLDSFSIAEHVNSTFRSSKKLKSIEPIKRSSWKRACILLDFEECIHGIERVHA